MGVADALLAHRLFFEAVDKILESCCSLALIMNFEFVDEGLYFTSDVVLVCVLVCVVLEPLDTEVFCNLVVLVFTVEASHVKD